MKKINLFWYKHKKGRGNFGDELNPYIIEKLSGQKVTYTNITFNKEKFFLSLKNVIRNYYHKRISFGNLLKYIYWNIKPPKTLFAIGSILQYSNSIKNTVWGSGIIEVDTMFLAGEILAVRGPYTQKRLGELGYKTPKVIGDPALLLPLIFSPTTIKNYRLGIIPHHIHYQYLRDNLPKNILVIDLLDDVEKIITQISSCDATLSTSLHGIIVSHCYNIPSLWANFSEITKKLYGDDIKFRDYFASVNLREYQPFVVEEISNFKVEIILHEMQAKFSECLLPDGFLIKKIQQDLIRVAPFEIKKN